VVERLFWAAYSREITVSELQLEGAEREDGLKLIILGNCQECS
jgi:hypothetical protein